MWDKVEKTFHLMHLRTVVSQLAANKTNRRTGLLCQNEKYKQLFETDLFFKTSEFPLDVLDVPNFGKCKNFLDNIQKTELVVKKWFSVHSKKGLAFQKFNWISKTTIGNSEV